MGRRLILPEYPGRGVVAFRDTSGELWRLYFLTGRSRASRDRVLDVQHQRIVVTPADDAGGEDPLRHYACVRTAGAALVVGNGDHVDAITDGLSDGVDLHDLLEQIDPEPDPPIHTSRIAMVFGPERVDLLSVRHIGGTIVRSVDRVALEPGHGALLHTYGGTTDSVRTDGEMHAFASRLEAIALADQVWAQLRTEVKVALVLGHSDPPEPHLLRSRYDD